MKINAGQWKHMSYAEKRIMLFKHQRNLTYFRQRKSPAEIRTFQPSRKEINKMKLIELYQQRDQVANQKGGQSNEPIKIG